MTRLGRQTGGIGKSEAMSTLLPAYGAVIPKAQSRWQAGLVPDVDWIAVLRADDGYRLRDAAEASAVRFAESALGVTFPAALRALYLASDGVFDEPGRWLVIWPLAEVAARNRAAWASAGTIRRELLAFGDDGTGAPLCVPVDGRPEVLFWSGYRR